MQTFKIEQTDTQCIVTWRHNPHVVVIVLWIIILAYVSPILPVFAHQIFVQHAFFIILIAIPFGIIWLLLLMTIAHGLFGKTQFVLNRDGLDATYTCLTIRSYKWFSLIDICCFEKVIHGRGCDYLRVVGLDDIASMSFRLPFARNLSDKMARKELDDLCNHLNAFLEMLKTEPQSLDCAIPRAI